MSASDDEDVLRQGWADFCDELKRAGEIPFRATVPPHVNDRTAGFEVLARNISLALNFQHDYADPLHPELMHYFDPVRKQGGDNTDAVYVGATINGTDTYRISGDRGSARYFAVTSVEQGQTPWGGKVAQTLFADDLKVDADGSFELICSPEPQPGNWLRTTPETSVLFIRQYAHDWSQTRDASFNIEQLGATGERPLLTVEEVSRALTRTATYVGRSAGTWAAIVDQRRAAAPNRFFVFELEKKDDDEEAPEMPSGHRFSSGYFRLAQDEALLVSFKPAEVPYWGLDTTNYWFEALSYAERRSHHNNRTVRYEPDGSVRIVIAPKDPGVTNWIDTRGHLEGPMLFRWSRTHLALPEIQAEVVKLADLAKN